MPQYSLSVAKKMRETFSLASIEKSLRIKADACRRLAERTHPPDSLSARNWRGLATELDSAADSVALHLNALEPERLIKYLESRGYRYEHGAVSTDKPGSDFVNGYMFAMAEVFDLIEGRVEVNVRGEQVNRDITLKEGDEKR